MSKKILTKGGISVTDWGAKPFYKTFTLSENKKLTRKMSDKYFEHRLEQVQSLSEYSAVLSANALLLDPDEQVHSDNLVRLIEGEKLSCMVTQRDGGRGVHALFLDDDGLIPKRKQKVMLACGVVVDLIPGKTNGLECLKLNGAEREIIYDVDEYQQLPKYLTPVSTRIDFTSLDEGDGRNQALFNYILTLQAAGFEIEEARTCIRLINKYVLKKPLSDGEIETITRDAAFQKPVFFKGSTFLHDKFAEYIKQTYHVKRINGLLHTYTDGVYMADVRALKRVIVKEIPQLNKAKISEVIERIETIADDSEQSNVNYIAFRNGVLNVDTGEISPCSPDVIITNRIPWDYNPNAYDELLDKTLEKICCGDVEIRTLIEEMVGACFYRSNTLGGGKAFMLTGEKNNGKSTLLEVIQTLMGEDNITALDLKNIDDRFSTGSLYGKLANIGDDIGDEYKADTSTFKKIVTGNTIKGEFKGRDEFYFKPYVKLIFSVNSPPKINDKTGAALRRLVIIPFNATFRETDVDYDPQIIWKLQRQSAIEYLIRLGVEGLRRVLKNKAFSKSTKADEAKNEYDRENNPVKAFVEEYGLDNIENEPTDKVYGAFEGYCMKNGFKGVLNKTNFSKQLKTHFELVTKPVRANGQLLRVYVMSIESDNL